MVPAKGTARIIPRSRSPMNIPAQTAMSHDAMQQILHLLQDDDYVFVTPTPASHARVNRRPGNEWADDLRGVFGWSRPFHDGTLQPALVTAMQQAGVLARHGDGWRSLVRVSSLGGMLFLHSAYPTEAADSVFFGPDTYRFANAIAAWLGQGHPVGRAVDIGCGAGPGACLVARSRPGAAVIAVDINAVALQLTQANAAFAGLPGVTPCNSNLLSSVDGEFDLIVSNPPYLADPAERAYRHGGGPLGAALSLAILDAAIARLAPGGTLLLYTGVAIVNGHDPFYAEAATRLAGRALDWSYREADPDVFGEELEHGPYVTADRIAAVVLTATRKV